uniref:Uncharacterized protein n=1 Tax=Aegilops tauschii subsp. strangulata TaxID=200361 RepID=A0A453S603_AEGTS
FCALLREEHDRTVVSLVLAAFCLPPILFLSSLSIQFRLCSCGCRGCGFGFVIAKCQAEPWVCRGLISAGLNLAL